MKKVAVIGASGYVGSQIAKTISQDKRYILIPINRSDSLELLSEAEIIIYAANPAKRFTAEKNPKKDFIETAEKVSRYTGASIKKRFFLISSLSCRTQLNSNYGRNRRACELITLAMKNSIVVRLGPMYGGNRIKDTLHDILAGNQVFVSEETRYAYVDVIWAAKKVVEMIEIDCGIYEIGAKNAVRLGDLRDYFSTSCKFTGYDDTQIPEKAYAFTDVNNVFTFAENEKKRIKEWS